MDQERTSDASAIAAWALPFVAVVFLGLNNGGYDVLERNEVGVVVWSLLLVCVLVGLLHVQRAGPAGKVALGLLVAFTLWTALSLIWTESDERTLIEVSRALTYTGFFVLAWSLQGEDRWRWGLGGLTCGVVLLCVVALLSRMEPSWFPADARAAGNFFGASLRSRLLYPLNYSGGIGSLGGIGMPLLLAATAYSRRIGLQVLAAAGIPLCALALWLSGSGLSVPVAVLAMLTFVVLTPDRIPKLCSLFVAACGSAILFAALVQRSALDDGLDGPMARAQGRELLAITLVVCAGVGIAQIGISLAVRYGERPQWLQVPRQTARSGALALLVALVVAAGVIGLAGGFARPWNHFKGGPAPNPGQESRAASILNYSSGGRYDFWRSALRAGKAHPVIGTGAGTFQFWWNRDGNSGFVKDAHSLYLESLAELGIVGFMLIAGFSGVILVSGCTRTFASNGSVRTGLAAATAGCVGFVAAATVDWMWELAVMPVIFLSLAGIVAASGARPRDARDVSRFGRLAGRSGLAAACLIAIVVIVVPLAESEKLDSSRSNAASGHLRQALDDAESAAAIEPYAATPHLQQALLLEQLNRLKPAGREIRKATGDEPTNWSLWVIRSRIAARLGQVHDALRSYRRARTLNPESILFREL
jgi:hypothetical protein